MNVFLISPNFIREHSNISANIQDKFLEGSIREVTDIDLRQVVGSCLLDKLKQLITPNASGGRDIDLPEYAAYKELLEQAKYYLLYMTVSRILPICSVKIDNMGSFQTDDERIEPLDTADMFQLMNYYQDRASYFLKLLQQFIINNRGAFPELDNSCDCQTIKEHLNTCSHTGLFLGGIRGRKIKISKDERTEKNIRKCKGYRKGYP